MRLAATNDRVRVPSRPSSRAWGSTRRVRTSPLSRDGDPIDGYARCRSAAARLYPAGFPASSSWPHCTTVGRRRWPSETWRARTAPLGPDDRRRGPRTAKCDRLDAGPRATERALGHRRRRTRCGTPSRTGGSPEPCSTRPELVGRCQFLAHRLAASTPPPSERRLRLSTSVAA